MTYFRCLAAALLGLFIAFAPAAAQPAPSAVRAPELGMPVRENGLVATWYPPASGKPGPVIIALGGSEGGEKGGQLLATALSRQGYGALALAYFGAEGLPEAAQNVPLEYFAKAIDWLQAQPLADRNRIGIYGFRSVPKRRWWWQRMIRGSRSSLLARPVRWCGKAIIRATI